MFDKRLKDFFNIYDTNGSFHNGFLQSINLSSYTDLTILNEITLNIMDYFLKNEIGNMKTQYSWNTFLQWDKEDKEYKINADFYDDAKYTIYAYLLKSQRFYELLNMNFSSLSAQETESIVYGGKEEQRDYDKVVVSVEHENDSTIYGAEELTKVFGAFEKETEYGNTRKDFNYGAKETETEFGATSETFNTGQQTNSSGTTNQTHPFDLQTFLDDTASDTSTTNGARQDTKTGALHTDTLTEKTHADYETNATHTDTETEKTHTDTETNATHTDTNTYGDITNTTNNRTDTTVIKTHTDTKTKTKTILISPDKYYEIMKEIMSYNVYNILVGAVKDCFTIKVF